MGGGAPSDAELLVRMRRGDRGALNAFFDRHESVIRARYRRKLGRALRRVFDSEDLLATVRRRVDRYVAAGTLEAEHERQLWALIGRIADRVVQAQVRTLKRGSSLDAGHVEMLDVLWRSRQPGEILERREFVRAVFSGMDRTEREIVVGSLRGRPQSEIGAELGMSEAAVRQRLYRVREGLRQTIADRA